MADRTWPPALRFTEALFQIVNLSRSGGQSLEGQEKIVVSPSGRWKAEVTIPIADGQSGIYRDQVLAYRSLVSGGRARTILVPTYDGRGPGHRAGIATCGYGVPHSDTTPFSDGTLYNQPFTTATTVAGPAMNATQMQILLATGLELLPGMRFSMPDGRLHEIDEVLNFQGQNIWTISFAPWARADYPNYTVLEFDRPVCRMRLATDETGPLTLSFNRFARPTLEFVEAF